MEEARRELPANARRCLETVALAVLRGTLSLGPKRRGRIGEERGIFPREELERVHLETREVDIDLMLDLSARFAPIIGIS